MVMDVGVVSLPTFLSGLFLQCLVAALVLLAAIFSSLVACPLLAFGEPLHLSCNPSLVKANGSHLCWDVLLDGLVDKGSEVIPECVNGCCCRVASCEIT